jgi:hypothetical protein
MSKRYSFDSFLDKTDGKFMSHFIPVPPEFLDKHKIKVRTRINGNINGHDFNLAIQSMKNGIFYLSASRDFCRQTKLKPGDKMTIHFTIADKNELNVPEELLEVIEQDDHFKLHWNGFSIGVRRGLSHYVASAKSIDTRIKRAIEIMNKSLKGELHIQKNSGKKSD